VILKKRIIAEGANATMLDMDFGTYPYITSSSTTVGGVCTGLGVPPKAIESVIGIMKAYTTRVGGGPFPSECQDEIGARLQKVGHEFGATTGRPRRCGWLDLNVVKFSHKLNRLTSINMTKLDVLTGIPTLRVSTHYELNGKRLNGEMPATLEDLAKCEVKYIDLPGWTEDISKVTYFADLPDAAKNYVNTVEKELGIPITWVGTGPEREAMFLKSARGSSKKTENESSKGRGRPKSPPKPENEAKEQKAEGSSKGRGRPKSPPKSA